MMTHDNTNAQASPLAAKPNPALKRLDVFVGEWEMQSTVGGRPVGRGRAAFEWLEGCARILPAFHRHLQGRQQQHRGSLGAIE
jgi:hypothetical protein